MVEKYILSNSGTENDSKDIFQDALYLFIKKADNPDFSLTSKLSTFLYGISKNLWLKQISGQKRDVDISEMEVAADLPQEEEYDKLGKVKFVKSCLYKLGEPCRTILEQFYFFKTSMKEIAEMLHYTNSNNAKNQKYKCFVRLKKMVLEGEK